MRHPQFLLLIIIITLLTTTYIPRATPKSTIEPCSTSNTCSSLLGYTLYTDLKVSQLATLFSTDPISILLTNSISISSPDVENHILPSQLFLKIPIPCSCSNGIRKSTSVSYRTRPSDTLESISTLVYGGLVSGDQIKDANPDVELDDPNVIPVGTMLGIPLPCVCFNNTDNGLPTVFMSYVVNGVDTLGGIAGRWVTTVSDLMNVNSLASVDVEDGDILAIPLSACASNFPSYAADYGLVVPNGSYAIAASHCVQCSCGPGNRNLYCTPASLAVSCSSMQCANSNLMIGNFSTQQSGGGCNVTSCSYNGYVNGSIATTLSTSLQSRCPGPQQFPTLIDPPTAVPNSLFAPAPSPSELGGFPTTNPSSENPSNGAVIFPPANGPAGSASGGGSSSDACSLMNQLTTFPVMLVFGFVVKFVL